jgi:polysaccharide export outer membrane protein
MKTRGRSLLSACALLATTLLLAACAAVVPSAAVHDATVFKPAAKSDRVDFLEAGALAELEATIDPIYRLGAGDLVTLQVSGRPDISGRHTVGPDGIITVPVAGDVQIETMTRVEAATAVRKQLDRYYTDPTVQLAVEQYTSYRITVLGRVQVPGQLAFDKPPTLLEALAKAGSLPVIDKLATLTRCAVFRGRDRIIWVDLKRLLNGGETAYNIRLQRGDLIYIPDSFDTLVYVFGAVSRPGAYRLTPDMSVLDAIGQAGGTSEDGDGDAIAIYRPSRQLTQRIRMHDLMTAEKRVNFSLEEGDVIYVPKTGFAEFGYYSRQFAAGLSLLAVGAVLAK